MSNLPAVLVLVTEVLVVFVLPALAFLASSSRLRRSSSSRRLRFSSSMIFLMIAFIC